MTAEKIVLIALQVTMFVSVIALGFKATLAEAFFLFRRPGLLLRTFLALYVVVPVVTGVVVAVVPLPIGIKVGLILLAISSVLTTSPHKMLGLGANPAYVFALLILMSLLAVITVPLSLAILTALPLAHDASVPPFEVAKLVALTFLLPLVLGTAIHRVMPRFAERIGDSMAAGAGKALLAILFALLVLNFGGVKEVTLLSFMVIVGLTVFALVAGHLLGGPAFGDRAALAIAAAERHTGMAALIAGINFPQAKGTIVVIVVYKIATMLVTIPYMKWCKHQIASQSVSPGIEFHQAETGQ